MNNNEFMNLLAIVSKNNNNKSHLIIIGAIAGLALTGGYLLYLKNKKTQKRYNELQSEHHTDKAQIVINNAQILWLNNTIKQLTAEKEIKANNSPDNNTPLTQETMSS